MRKKRNAGNKIMQSLFVIFISPPTAEVQYEWSSDISMRYPVVGGICFDATVAFLYAFVRKILE